jgi:hypothetical protein
MDFIEKYRNIEDSLNDDFLAYSFCSTQIERLLFEKIGFEIDKILGSDHAALVEFKRYDLVILDKQNKNIKIVIEGKQTSTFDTKFKNVKTTSKWWSKLLEDFDNLNDLSTLEKDYRLDTDIKRYTSLVERMNI